MQPMKLCLFSGDDGHFSIFGSDPSGSVPKIPKFGGKDLGGGGCMFRGLVRTCEEGGRVFSHSQPSCKN